MTMQEDSFTEPELGVNGEESGPVAEVVPDACLVAVSGTTSGKVFRLLRRETLIGRLPEADIRIDDRSISGRHAKIVREHGEHTLWDLGSMNGTFLNGQRIVAHQPFSLAHGDNIQVAETTFAYLPNNARDSHEQTQYLARVPAQQIPGPTPVGVSDAQLIAQLLQSTMAPPREPPPPTLEEQIEKLLKLWAMVKRNWVVLFAAAALCALIGNASVFLSPPPSEALSKLRITPPKSDQNPWDRDNLPFYTQVEQNFMSSALIENTLKSLGEARGRRGVGESAAALKFRGIAHQTYEASFSDPDPKYAVRFLEHHLRGYLDSEVDRTLHVLTTEVGFLTQRLKEREEELRRTETQLRDFKQKHLEGLPEHTQGHIAAREALFARRAAVAAEAARASLELAEARKRLTQEDPLLTRRVERAAPYEQSLSEARRKLSEARAKGFGDQHAEVIALNSQIKNLEKLAEEARTKDTGTMERDATTLSLRHRVGDLQVSASAAGAELGQINAEIARLEGIVNKMPEVEAQYAQLTRSYQVNKDNHAQLLEQLKTSQLKLELERTSAKARYEIIEPPGSSGVPLRKALIKRTMIGLALGLALGAAVAAFIELRRYLRKRLGRGRGLDVPSTALTRE